MTRAESRKKIDSFWENLASLFSYHCRVVHLLLRGGLPLNFARVMAAEGQTRREEVRCLYDLARQGSKGGVIVEIGSYRGLSTIALATGSYQGPQIPVYAIDPHESDTVPGVEGIYGSRDNTWFMRNVLFSGVAELVRPINLFSMQAVSGWKKPISLLWIDGNHGYDSVKNDFQSWSPFVLREGYVVFHDSSNSGDGPYRVIREALAQGRFEKVHIVEKVSVLKRTERQNG